MTKKEYERIKKILLDLCEQEPGEKANEMGYGKPIKAADIIPGVVEEYKDEIFWDFSETICIKEKDYEIVSQFLCGWEFKLMFSPKFTDNGEKMGYIGSLYPGRTFTTDGYVFINFESHFKHTGYSFSIYEFRYMVVTFVDLLGTWYKKIKVNRKGEQ